MERLAPTARSEAPERASFTQALDAVAAPIWVTDPQGRATWSNRAWRELTATEMGHTPSPSELIPERALTEAIAGAIRSGERRSVSCTLRHANGHESAITVHVDAMRAASGTLLGAVCTCERAAHPSSPHALAAALDAERMRVADIVSTVPGVVWETWSDPRPEAAERDFVSHHITSMTGYTREEWLATPDSWLNIVHDEDRERVVQARREHFARGGFGRHQARWVTKDGRVLDVLTHAVVITDVNGTPVGMRGVSLDVTDRARVEAALLDQTTLYQSLLNAQSDMGEGVVVFDGAHVLFANQAFTRLTGYSYELLQDKTLADLMSPRSRAAFERRMRVRHARAPKPQELELRTRSGVAISAEVITKRLSDDDERRVAIIRETTQRKSAEQALAAARRQIAQSEKLSLLGSLVSGLAHEIRTPLAYLENHVAIIETRLQRADRDPSSIPVLLTDLPGHAAAAHEGVDRINRLVKDLRRFIKMEAGIHRASRLDEVVADALRLYRSVHADHSNIHADLQPTPAIPLDQAQVQQVVINLLDNAASASPERAPIQLLTRHTARGVQLIVADGGIGIPAEALERIYDPFFSTKPDGTGLGLAIVRRIIESHKGTIECDTSIGKGTRFTVTFPAQSAPVPNGRKEADVARRRG